MSVAVAPLRDSGAFVRLERADCPRCGSEQGRTVVEGQDFLYGVPGRFFVWECAECGLQYQNPRPIPEHLPLLYPANYGPHGGSTLSAEGSCESSRGSKLKQFPIVRTVWPLLHAARSSLRGLRRRAAASLTQIGRVTPTQWQTYLRHEMGYSHLQSSAVQSGRVRRRRQCRRIAGIDLIPYFVPEGRLLEIGCATGDRLQTLREMGWNHLEGIELAEPAAEQARQKGFPVLSEPVETALDQFPDESLDAVVSSMVIEHLYNPFETTRAIARKLRPDGQFLFSTVTRDSLDARLFGRYWGGYDFPRHMVYLRLGDIRRMLSDAFDVVAIYHQNAPVDFYRAAKWRKSEGKLIDRIISKLAGTSFGDRIGDLLARMGKTCRVSFRCHKKP